MPEDIEVNSIEIKRENSTILHTHEAGLLKISTNSVGDNSLFLDSQGGMTVTAKKHITINTDGNKLSDNSDSAINIGCDNSVPINIGSAESKIHIPGTLYAGISHVTEIHKTTVETISLQDNTNNDTYLTLDSDGLTEDRNLIFKLHDSDISLSLRGDLTLKKGLTIGNDNTNYPGTIVFGEDSKTLTINNDVVLDQSLDSNSNVGLNSLVLSGSGMTGSNTLHVTGSTSLNTLDISGNTVFSNSAIFQSIPTFKQGLVTGSVTNPYDVKFYGYNSGELNWNMGNDTNKLQIIGHSAKTALEVLDGNVIFTGNLLLEGNLNLEGTLNIDNSATFGTSTSGSDVIFYGSSGSTMTWG